MTLRAKLYRVYHGIQRVLAPKLEFSQASYERVLDRLIEPDTRWLDLGCGHQLLPAWRVERERELVQRCCQLTGLDYDLPALRRHASLTCRVRGNITDLPFRPDIFDLVTANMVVEHLSHPATQFRQIRRVLKPGGLFIFHTPNALGYSTLLARLVPDSIKRKLIYLLDGRKQEDVFPTHYRANTRRRIATLAQSTGFEVMKVHMIVSSALSAMILPLAVFELVWIRLLMTAPLQGLRTNMIVQLRRPAT